MKKIKQMLMLAIGLLLAMPIAAQSSQELAAERQARDYWNSQVKGASRSAGGAQSLNGFRPTFGKGVMGGENQFKVRRADGTAITIYGNVIYSTDSEETYGIYSFPAEDGLTFTPIKKDENLYALNGGVYANGKYYFMNFFHFYEYDADTWEVVRDEQLTFMTGGSLQATALAWNQADNKIYGCFMDYSTWSYIFGTVDYTELKTTKIASLGEILRCVVATPAGEVYGLQENGDLLKFDTTTGESTKVGNVGMELQGVQQGAVCDPESGICYWAAAPKSGTSGLYTIDLSDASVSLISEFSNDEEVVGLFIPNKGTMSSTPAKPSDLTVNFPDGKLQGTVSFVMPSTMVDGGTMSGQIGYTVSIDDVEVLSGTANAGASVTTESFTVAGGKHKVAVAASNTVGVGPETAQSLWFGNDAPEAVSDLKVAASGNQMTVSWTAPTKGLNEGYFCADSLSYTIVRNPGEVVVAERTKATSVVDEINDESMNTYTYTVTPYNGSVAGQTATSEGVKYGTAVTPPYLNNFDDENAFAMFSANDANGDGSAWKWESWTKSASLSSGYFGNDDWLISPPVILKKDYLYRFHFTVSSNSSYDTHHVSAWLGTKADVASLTTPLVAETAVTASDVVLGSDVTVEQDGTYYFAIRANDSEYCGSLSVDSFAIEKGISLNAPDSVTYLKAVAAENGKLEATVSFYAPTQTGKGEMLGIGDVTKIELYRDGELIQTYTEVNATSSFNYTDTEVSEGLVTYTALPYGRTEAGMPASTSCYVGIDVPGVPADVKALEGEDGVDVSWTAPAVGLNGGYFDASSLYYQVQRTGEDGSLYLVTAKTTDTSVKDDDVDVDGDQKLVAYGVFALNDKGYSTVGISNMVLVGKPYALPYSENFASGSIKTFWGIEASTDATVSLSTATSSDNDGGCVEFRGKKAGVTATLYSGKIALTGSTKPTLTFDVQNVGGVATKLALDVVKPDGTTTTVATYDLGTSSAWQSKSVSLADFVGERYVQVYFRLTAESAGSDIYLDNVAITDKGTTGISATESVNEGSNNFSVYTIDGQLVKSTATSLDRLHRGVYVVNGRKVTVK